MLPSLRSGAQEHRDRLAESLKTGMTADIRKLSKEDIKQYEEWLGDEALLLRQAVHQVEDDEKIAEIMKIEDDQEKIHAFLGGTLPPIHIYRTSFEINFDSVILEDDFPPATWKTIQNVVTSLKKRYAEAIATGTVDDRRPLDPVRRLWFQQVVDRFDEEEHPEHISEEFTETECNVFGHVCPVFFAAEAMTETSEPRRMGRRPIPFATMMRIVRRDDYRCQHCKKKLRDYEVEFDHIIPVSKGGSSEEHNLRLTCFKCNRDKRDDYVP
jgi:hypothetical protein